jgi:hypothetical protein
VRPLLAAALILLMAEAAPARVVSSVEAVQYQVRRARDIAEMVVNADRGLEVAKTWKGDIPTLSLTFDEYEPGQRLLVLFYEDDTKYVRLEDAEPYLRYLESPQPVSRRELLQMLRGWEDRTIDDDAFAKWLHETKPVAEVEDWFFLDDGQEYSVVLFILEDLDYRMNGRGEDEQTCVRKVLRERVAPDYIRALDRQTEALPITRLMELEACP